MPRSPRVAGLVRLALLSSVVFLAGCGREEASTPSVVFISIDTLRADALGCYGASRNSSPRLDEFAREAVVFRDAIANSNNTLISHMSMLTGLYPTAHRVAPGKSPLLPSFGTLAEALRGQGYSTAFFAAHGDWLNRRYGFDRGFQTFESAYVWADRINGQVKRWLSRKAREPFFLFAHYYDPHSDFKAKGPLPYRAPDGFFGTYHDASDGLFTGCDEGGKRCASGYLKYLNENRILLDPPVRERIRALYDEEVLYTDSMVAKVLDDLERRGLYDRSIIVITSDHGEEFQENGRFLHGSVFEEVARVPLLVRFPGGEPRGEVREMVEGVDVVPTILDYLGLPPLEGIDGESVLPLLEGGSRRKALGMVHGVAVRSSKWKAILRGSERSWLFDLETDPQEEHDVADEHPDVLERMESYRSDLVQRHAEEYARRFEANARATTDAPPVEVSDEERARLKALGYYEDGN